MKKILTSRLTLAIMLLVMSIFNLFSIGEKIHLRRQFEIFEQYLNDYQADLLEWYKNPGGEDD